MTVQAASTHAILLILYCLTGALAVSQSISYHASDAFGNLYGEVSEFETRGDGYWAIAERRELLETRKIYHGGELVGVLRAEYASNGSVSKETLFVDDAISTERVFDGYGAILSEREFLPGGAVREIAYRYKSKRLVEKESSDGKGGSSTVTYVYGIDGRLLEARGSGSSSSGSGSTYANETSVWIRSGDGIIVTKYNSAGKPAKTEYFSDRVLREIEEFTYDDGRIALKKTSYPPTTKFTERRYDAKGLLRTEETFVDGRLAEKSEYEYREDMSLKRKTTRGGGLVHVVELSRIDDMPGETERHYENDVLTTVIERVSDEEYSVETYDSGVLVVKVYFVDGRKSKEQFWESGSVVKERTFP